MKQNLAYGALIKAVTGKAFRMSKTIRVSVDVSEEAHAKLKELAVKDRRSLAGFCAVQLEKIAGIEPERAA